MAVIMDEMKIRRIVEKQIEKDGGILRLRPTFVSRTHLCAGRRLGLKEEEYSTGKRGEICERWFGSETEADNDPPYPNEGLTFLNIEDAEVLLRDATKACAKEIMGSAYAADHKDLGRLAKIFDYGSRLFLHLHQMRRDTNKIGKNPKEEAYYFPMGIDLGNHPETFFGVHPYIVTEGKQQEILLPYLIEWNSDLILRHSRAYLDVPGDGFHLPAGLLHAPGSVLTIELQEPSDVASVFQAKVERFNIPKTLLYKDIPPQEWKLNGEIAALQQVDWPANGDPLFYEHHHTAPIAVAGSVQKGGNEEWIHYNSRKFSGKRLVVKPHEKYVSHENGVYNIVVWSGLGKVDSQIVEGKNIGMDEVLVVHDRAVEGVVFENTGSKPLEVFKFFGPDINNEVVPFLPHPNMKE
jgi:hypothetical protein